MTRKIDLHGLDINRATAVVINSLRSFDYNSYEDELLIVTGNGTGSLKNLVEDILNEECYDWSYDNSQQSAFRVYK
ncbi:Smr/MutS family protein [Mycoplasma sp. 128]